MEDTYFKWLLFDVGDVLVNYKPLGFSRLSEYLSIDPIEIDNLIHSNSVVQNITKGLLSPDQFVNIINTQFGSSLTINTIVELFCYDVKCVFPEIPALVASLKKHYSLGVLSKVFFGHWDYFIRTDLAKQFNVLSASHLLDCRKPEKEIYDLALERIKAQPAEVLFIDDKEENVASSKALGIAAFQTHSPSETISGLKRFRIEI